MDGWFPSWSWAELPAQPSIHPSILCCPGPCSRHTAGGVSGVLLWGTRDTSSVFLIPTERTSWGIVAVGQREGAWSSVGGDRERVTRCQQCHAAHGRAEVYQGRSWGCGNRDAASISPALWGGFPGKLCLWAWGKEQCERQGQGDRILAVSLCPQ